MKLSGAGLMVLLQAVSGAGLDSRQDNSPVSVTIQPLPAELALGQSYTVNYTVNSPANIPSTHLLLLGTTAGSGQAVTTGNTFQAIDLQSLCFSPGAGGNPCFQQGLPNSLTFSLQSSTASSANNFFLCFSSAADGSTCDSYSNAFNIGPAEAGSVPPESIQIPQAPLSVTSTITTIVHIPYIATYTPTSALVTGTFTSIAATVSALPTGTVTEASPGVTAASDASLSSSSRHSSGLSTGAKIGIAIGALIIVALLLLCALFFLRRKHRRRAIPAEHQMLNRDRHIDSFSRKLIVEKETEPDAAETAHPAAPLSPNSLHVGPADDTPVQRHSTLSGYDSIYSDQYAAVPTAVSSAVPKRNPTTQTVQSSRTDNTTTTSITRGLSAASNISGPISPRSATTGRTPSMEFEAYHDVPIYGDARHSPQIFQGLSAAPFLTEEGMTVEEVARLEEEERRIDAAIAEAERR